MYPSFSPYIDPLGVVSKAAEPAAVGPYIDPLGNSFGQALKVRR